MQDSTTSTLSYRMLLGSMVGNALEWYDFILFATFAPLFSQLFFPTFNHLVAMLSTFSVFALGFLMRPLGGILFGHYGDKFGRTKLFGASVVLITIPTVLMGLLPTYHQIGIISPILLLLCRMLQGLIIGGEYTGSMLIVGEQVKANRRGYFTSWVIASCFLGILLGYFVNSLLNQLMPAALLTAWGWRLPFALTILFAIIGWNLRQNLPEPKEFRQLEFYGGVVERPIKTLIRDHLPLIIKCVLILWCVAVGQYYLVVYSTSYIVSYTKLTMEQTLSLNLLNICILIMAMPLFGHLADKVGKRKMAVFSFLLTACLAMPIFWLISSNHYGLVFLGQLIFTLIVAMMTSPVPAMLIEIFPTPLRYSGVALVYNLSYSLFAGSAPLIAMGLSHYTNDPLSPSFYLIIVSLISASMICIFFRRTNSNTA